MASGWRQQKLLNCVRRGLCKGHPVRQAVFGLLANRLGADLFSHGSNGNQVRLLPKAIKRYSTVRSRKLWWTALPIALRPAIIGAGGPKYTAFSADSRRVAVWGFVSELGRTLAVWDVPNDRQLQALALDSRDGGDNDWLSAAFSPDGTRLAASDKAGNIYVYDTANWTQVAHWAVPGSAAQP